MNPDREFSHFSEGDVSRLYPILRRMAAQKMACERPGHTLQPTALVHEAWMRMRERDDQHWRDATHFCAAAAETMRRILIDRARYRGRKKHGGNARMVSMALAEELPSGGEGSIALIGEALDRLEAVDAVRAKVVLLRYFGGLSNREIASDMGVTERTVERYWSYARAWLYREIQSDRR